MILLLLLSYVGLKLTFDDECKKLDRCQPLLLVRVSYRRNIHTCHDWLGNSGSPCPPVTSCGKFSPSPEPMPSKTLAMESDNP